MTAPFATALLGWKQSSKNKLGWPLVPNSLRSAQLIWRRLTALVTRTLASDPPAETLRAIPTFARRVGARWTVMSAAMSTVSGRTYAILL